MSNFFQCQGPVVGDDFFGRQNIIHGILDDERLSHAWIIGARRSGKTSILKQLDYIVHHEESYSDKYIPVYWNMEGIINAQYLKERFVDGLARLNSNNKDKFDILGIGIKEADSKSIKDIFRKIGHSVMERNIQLLLLCDGVENLVSISDNDEHIISDLQYHFQRDWTRAVICATGSLRNLKKKNNKGLSSFLSIFTPPKYFLGSLNKKDALSLIQRGKEDSSSNFILSFWEAAICQASNQSPYYLQLLCSEFCNSKPSSIDEAIDKAFHCQDFDVLKNDLNGLTFVEKMALLIIVENPGISLGSLKKKMYQEVKQEDIELVRNLNLLGYINQTTDHCFKVQNVFLQKWYKNNLRRIIEESERHNHTEPEIPEIIKGQLLDNQYRVIEVVGKTGHSQVVKAWDGFLDSFVAIKCLHLDQQSEEIIQQYQDILKREVRILAVFRRHPNIGQVHDLIQDPLGIVMEWIEGRSLREIIDDYKQPQMSVFEVINIGIKLSDALICAHNNEIIHRDIKPANIIVNNDNEPMLIDFDIARASTQHTIRGGATDPIGTLQYMAPEQFSAPEAVASPADMFALGLVLYEMLTHTKPYKWGGNLRLYQDGFPKPEQHEIPDSLYQILCKLLSEKPDCRYNASDLKQKLQNCLSELEQP